MLSDHIGVTNLFLCQHSKLKQQIDKVIKMSDTLPDNHLSWVSWVQVPPKTTMHFRVSKKERGKGRKKNWREERNYLQTGQMLAIKQRWWNALKDQRRVVAERIFLLFLFWASLCTRCHTEGQTWNQVAAKWASVTFCLKESVKIGPTVARIPSGLEAQVRLSITKMFLWLH